MTERDGMAGRERQRAPRLIPAGGPPSARVWVLDEPRAESSEALLAVAQRLGVAFRRVPLVPGWLSYLPGLGHRSLGLVPGNPAPQHEAAPLLVLASGRRASAAALWLKARVACRVVAVPPPGLPGTLARLRGAAPCDLLVVPEPDRILRRPNVLPVLGTLHRVGPQALQQASAQWGERLDHMASPRVALLVGGPGRGADLEPARAHSLARAIARLVSAAGGSIMASTSRRTGREATDALAAGLGGVMHLLHRWGEPGENPYLGFLAIADAILVAGDSAQMLSEACATAAPVYAAVPELAGGRHRRLLASLIEAGQVRPFRSSLSPWPRAKLDESGRVAAEIRRRFPVE